MHFTLGINKTSIAPGLSGSYDNQKKKKKNHKNKDPVMWCE